MDSLKNDPDCDPHFILVLLKKNRILACAHCTQIVNYSVASMKGKMSLLPVVAIAVTISRDALTSSFQINQHLLGRLLIHSRMSAKQGNWLLKYAKQGCSKGMVGLLDGLGLKYKFLDNFRADL